MKFAPLPWIGAVAALLAGQASVPAYGQSASVQSTGYAYEGYYGEDAAPAASPSDSAPAATAAPAEKQQDGCNSCDSQCGCDSGCDSCCEDSCCDDGCFDWPCCEHGDAWTLFDCPCSKLKINGWLAQGYTWNPDRPADRFNGPVTFNDRSNEYQMNQLYLYAEKPVDTEGCGWDVGGRVDLLYGTDFRFTLAQGLDAQDDLSPRWGSSRFYGLAMPQVYGEVGYNDLKVKVGHYYTIIGYETVMATGNYFYSHAYTHQYGEPFTHTGVLASWAANDRVTIHGGIDRGWDNFEDLNDSEAFLGGITVTNEDKDRSLAYALHTGDEANFFNGINANRFVQSIVYSNNLTDDLKYVFETDYGIQDGIAAPDAEWYGVNQYLIRTINECWSWGVRAEWFRDDDGTRVAPVGDFTGGNTASVGGFAGNFYEVTAGLNWKPNANWIVRPELRYDWYDGPDNGLGNQPFDDGSDSEQFLAAFDVILTY